jgi:hypothetical protein
LFFITWSYSCGIGISIPHEIVRKGIAKFVGAHAEREHEVSAIFGEQSVDVSLFISLVGSCRASP